jgi:hypothetical protein
VSPAELFKALEPHFAQELASFRKSFPHGRLRTFIIKHDLMLELVPGGHNIRGLLKCSKCFARTVWLQVGREKVMSYCEQHHPKPSVHNERKPT